MKVGEGMRKKALALGITLLILGIFIVISKPSANPLDVLLFYIIGYVMSIVGIVLALIGFGTIIVERL